MNIPTDRIEALRSIDKSHTQWRKPGCVDNTGECSCAWGATWRAVSSHPIEDIVIFGHLGHKFDGREVKRLVEASHSWLMRPGYHPEVEDCKQRAARLASRLWRKAMYYRSLNPLDACTRCDGLGKVIGFRKSSIYRQGFVSVAETCPVCHGSGKKAGEVVDLKRIASGDSQ